MSNDRSPCSTLLIIVHYKSGDSLLALLESLKNVRGLDSVDILITDNYSGENHSGLIEPVAPQFPNFELLELPQNKGYFGAANSALTHYLSQCNSFPEWIIVSNADVLFEDAEFFEKLSAHETTAIGVLAPRISVPSQGLEQNPFMMHPPSFYRRFVMRFYSAWYPLGLLWDWLSRTKRSLFKMISFSASPILEDKQQIYAAHGSFFIFNRNYFLEGGVLDDSLFLFGEEIAVAETCRRLKLKILYDPSLRILHDEHSSVGAGMSKTAYGYHKKSVQHLFSKYLQGY